MKISDLHTHTYYSDGQLSPKELVRKAKEKGVKYLAITDHNSVRGNEGAIKEGKKLGIEIIPGVEVMGKEFEVLGYFIDYESEELKKDLLRCGYYANEKIKRITDLLKKKQGEDISFSKLRKKFPNADKNYNNGHLFYYLMSKGYKFDEAVGKVMKAKKEIKKPEKKDIIVVKAIKLIRKYNGVPVLSHPWTEKDQFTEENIKEYVKAGLRGIEYENGEKK